MDPKRFTRRLVALGAVMFLCALVFVVTLFDAQIVNGDDYLAQSVRANAKVETVKGTRGVITDRNGKVLVSNRAVYTLDFDSSLVPDDELNDALLRLIALMNAQGVEIKESNSMVPIVPFYTYDEFNTLAVAKRLYDEGVYVNPVLPPACPQGSCMLRCSLMATHTEALLDEAMDIISDVMVNHHA